VVRYGNEIEGVDAGRFGEHGETDLADELAEEEIVQLAEDKERKRKDIVPHWPDFVENYDDNICHDAEEQEDGTGLR
jgi:hypothetical protein